MAVRTLKPEHESVKISFLTDKTNRDALDTIATALDRDRSYILNDAITAYLEMQQWHLKDALKQSKKPTRGILPAIGKSGRHSPNTGAMRVK